MPCRPATSTKRKQHDILCQRHFESIYSLLSTAEASFGSIDGLSEVRCSSCHAVPTIRVRVSSAASCTSETDAVNLHHTIAGILIPRRMRQRRADPAHNACNCIGCSNRAPYPCNRPGALSQRYAALDQQPVQTCASSLQLTYTRPIHTPILRQTSNLQPRTFTHVCVHLHAAKLSTHHPIPSICIGCHALLLCSCNVWMALACCLMYPVRMFVVMGCSGTQLCCCIM